MTIFNQYRKQEPLNEVTRAQRVAGAILIGNAVMVLLGVLLIGDTLRAGSAALTPTMGLGAAVIDVVIGVSLLRGSRTLVPWALLRTAAGLLLHGGIYLASKNWFGAVQMAIFCASMLALLIGDAGRLRMGFALAGIGLVWLAEIGGIAVVTTGRNPLGALIASASGSIESEPAARVTGEAWAYSLEVPNDRWYLRPAEAAKKDNPIVDKWLTRPDVDAHIMVIVEHMPGVSLAIEAYTDAVVKASRGAMTSFSSDYRGPWAAYPQNGSVLEVTASTKGLTFFYSFRLLVAGDRAVQVIGFGHPKVPEEARAEMRQIMDSFKPPPGTRLTPLDLEDAVAGRIAGVSYGYSVETPNAQWHVRKAEVAKKDNPLVDRWLVRPDLKAHVLIVAEHEPGAVVDIEAYTDTVLSLGEKPAQSFQVIEKKPWRGPGESARFARTRSTINGLSAEYCYGLVTRGDRAFQVIGFAPLDTFSAAQQDILHILNSFTLPPPDEADSARRDAGSP